jgi:ubiquinone/menaquinone biosynthesis C-methylase UbiE
MQVENSGSASNGQDQNASSYVLGHSHRELERLRRQAQLVDPITRSFLVDAGIGAGMRVLDVGCGAGDVSFLAADLVGPTGFVVGVDRSPVAIARAGERAQQRMHANVAFHQSELSSMAFDRPFDAIIGRYVLCFQSEPAALLRSMATFLRPGGTILFHEPDRMLMHSIPPVPVYDRACEWVSETYRRSGVDVRMGIKLYAAFVEAGLEGPTMRLQAIIGGANALDEMHLDADQALVLAADMERLGVASAGEVDAETLVERIAQELRQSRGVIIGRAEIGAWSRV